MEIDAKVRLFLGVGFSTELICSLQTTLDFESILTLKSIIVLCFHCITDQQRGIEFNHEVIFD